MTITASLRNMGFITHSFASGASDPIIFGIRYRLTQDPKSVYDVWYSGFHGNITEFSIAPDQPLERQVVWNQTRRGGWREQELETGSYFVRAEIPTTDIDFHNLFEAATEISITT